MKQIVTGNQVNLGFSRVVRITADGIRYRLFRSAVTMVVVAVAVAFLMNVLGESLVKRTVGNTARIRLAELHRVHDWAARLASDLPGSDLEERIAAGDMEVMRAAAAAGLTDDPAVVERVRAQAAVLVATRHVEQCIRNDGVRRAIAARCDIMPGDVTVPILWDGIRGESDARWFIEVLRKAEADLPGVDVEGLLRLARHKREEDGLVQAVRLTVGAGEGWMGLGERMGWLLAVSMLVCGIGIANAMLMSVTERFREIATMKCLGALDGMIMGIFVLESCFLGLVGGLMGALLGAAIALGRMLVAFGPGFAAAFPVGEVALAMFVAAGTGIALAALAAVYPAFKAARLAPMEAMRVQ